MSSGTKKNERGEERRQHPLERRVGIERDLRHEARSPSAGRTITFGISRRSRSIAVSSTSTAAKNDADDCAAAQAEADEAGDGEREARRRATAICHVRGSVAHAADAADSRAPRRPPLSPLSSSARASVREKPDVVGQRLERLPFLASP